MADRPKGVPPRWFVTTAWRVHRAIRRVSGGRLGLRRPRPGVWGMLELVTIGRKSGKERRVVLAYLEDGDDLVLMVMNGWGEGHPAWFANLMASPDVTAITPDGPRAVRAVEVSGAERDRLWARWCETDDDLDEIASARSTRTPVLVLRPRAASAPDEPSRARAG